MLEPLELQPRLEEGRVGVEVPAVHVQAGGVPAVHQHLVERRAPAAHRVEDLPRAAGHRAARPDGHVQQQLGEQLVGLAGVLEDRQQVVVELVPPRQRHRSQDLAVQLEQGHRGRHVAEQREVAVGEIGVEDEVGHAGDPGRLGLPEAVPQPGGGEHAELRDGERLGGEGVDPVGRRVHEQGVPVTAWRHARQSGLTCDPWLPVTLIRNRTSAYSDLLPLGPDETPYRLVTTEGVSTFEADGRTFLQVSPDAIRRLTAEAMHDIAHYLRPAHLAQLRRIIDDPESSGNDRFVALDLLKNVNISAGGVLPMCQDTGTAIVMGKKSEGVLTGADDAEAISLGVYDAYTRLNLRYSQLAPITMWEEKNTGTNLPAQIELYSTPSDDGHGPAYKFLFMAKGGGSANKSFLYQETKAVLNPKRMLSFLDEKIRSLGTAACPPYHLAVVIGGTSAEYALKTAKYASAHYLDNLPTSGSLSAHGFRDLELEEEVFKLTQSFGIGAQFGGKYFCHDVRVVRLPRHGASCPVAVAVSCSADRQALGKITAEGVFLEQLETDPAHYMPDAGVAEDISGGSVVQVDLRQPMDAILAELSRHPVKTRLSLTGPLVVARDIAHAKIKERLDAGEEMPSYLRDHAVYYAGPAKTPTGHGLRVVRPDHGRADGLLRRAVPGGRRVEGDAGQGQPVEGRHRGVRDVRRVLPRLDRRPGRPAGPGLHPVGRGARVPRARHGGRLEDRGRGLPRLHRRRRQGQRLLHRPRRHRHRPALRYPGQVRRLRRETASESPALRPSFAVVADRLCRLQRPRRVGTPGRPGVLPPEPDAAPQRTARMAG